MPSSYLFRHAQICLAGTRSLNEDLVHADPEQGRFLVADGCGGEGKGDRASAILRDCLMRPEPATLALERANSLILQAIEREHLGGMGTTFAFLSFQDSQAELYHMGNVRAYLIREGRLLQLTEDHTLATQLLQAKPLSEAEVAAARKVILRYLGKGTTRWDSQSVQLQPMDTLLLCTDGFYSVLEPEVLIGLATAEALNDRLEAAARQAIANGSQDNLGAIALQIGSIIGTPALDTTRRLRAITERLLFSPNPEADLQIAFSDMVAVIEDALGASGRIFRQDASAWRQVYPSVEREAPSFDLLQAAVDRQEPIFSATASAVPLSALPGGWVLHLERPVEKERLAPYRELLAWLRAFIEIVRLRIA